jgi:hypothetical protein
MGVPPENVEERAYSLLAVPSRYSGDLQLAALRKFHENPSSLTLREIAWIMQPN